MNQKFRCSLKLTGIGNPSCDLGRDFTVNLAVTCETLNMLIEMMMINSAILFW